MTAALTVRDLRVAYGRIEVVHGVSFTASAGRVTCLLGANGAGKTTTIRGLLGLRVNRSGTVLVGDVDVSRHEAHQMAGLGIAYVPEGRRVFARLSVRDNLRMGAATRARRWRGDDTLDRVLDTFPELAARLDDTAGLLSGGQQQMLAIARALVTEPRLLLLDEPNEGLAPVIVQQIGALIDRLAETTTILFTDQSVPFALKHASRGYILQKGRVVYQGSTETIRNDPEVQERYLSVA